MLEIEIENIESMDGKQVKTIIEYSRDTMDELETYINKNGAVPKDIADALENLNGIVDSIYEKITIYKNEATSGIGAGSYTTKAIDLMEENDDFESLSKEDILCMIKFTKEHPEEYLEDDWLYSEEFEGKTYYLPDFSNATVEFIEDGKISVPAYDEDGNEYTAILPIIDTDDGDPENGPNLDGPKFSYGDIIEIQ